VSFARILQIVDEEFMRIIPGQKVTRAIFACRADDDEELCYDSDSVKVGAFGVPIAKCRVIETSGRDALHAHELIVTAASPALLAMYADNDDIFQEIASALETQITARTDWEVHVVRKAQKALRCRGPAATFVTSGCERPTTAIPGQAAPLQVQLSAAILGNHCHTNSCHEGDRGAIGCRGGYSKGHPQPTSSIVQVVFADAVPTDAVLAGNSGDPLICGNPKCQQHWNGENMLQLKLIKPQSQPPFPSGEDKVYTHVCFLSFCFTFFFHLFKFVYLETY